MVQLVHKSDKCIECGHEGFQWGMVVSFTRRDIDESGNLTYTTVSYFICRDCIETILKKLDDMIENAKHLLKVNEKELQLTGKTTLRTRGW